MLTIERPGMAMLTVKEAAEKLGLSRPMVQRLIETGRLPAQKFGNAWVIDEEALQALPPRKVGRPVTTGKGLRHSAKIQQRKQQGGRDNV